jgi:hypothetical protein
MERGAGAGNARSAAAEGTADSEGDSKEMQPPFAAWRRGEEGREDRWLWRGRGVI